MSDKRETGCNANYYKFKSAGYTVFPINPRLATFDGGICYPNLLTLPEIPDGVFILARPMVTEEIIKQCAQLKIKRVWMHCMMGTIPGLAAAITSVSLEAVKICKENGISIIPGSCPNQFLRPDISHQLMRSLWHTLGFLAIET